MTKENLNNLTLITSAFGVFIFLFLFIFQPFGISELEVNKLSYTASFGLVTLIVMFLGEIFESKIIKRKKTENKLREIIIDFWIVIPIACANWFVANLWGYKTNFGFLIMLFITLIIGIIPFAIMYLFMERKRYRESYFELSEKMHQNQVKEKKEPENIEIISENIGEKITFKSNELLYVKAEGNYALFCCLQNERTIKKLMRISLNKIMEQIELQEQTSFIRNHKSYIVNLDNVDKVVGNSKQYNFHIKHTDLFIPVSRTFSKEIIEKIRNAS